MRSLRYADVDDIALNVSHAILYLGDSVLDWQPCWDS